MIDVGRVGEMVQSSGHEVVCSTIDFQDSKKQPYDTLLICSQTEVNADIKQHFPGLRNVVCVGTGLDNVDLNTVSRRITATKYGHFPALAAHTRDNPPYKYPEVGTAAGSRSAHKRFAWRYS